MSIKMNTLIAALIFFSSTAHAIETKNSEETTQFSLAHCQQFQKIVQKPLIKLYKVLPKEKRAQISTKNRIYLKIKDKHCTQPKWQAKTIKAMKAWFQPSTEKTAVILPLTGKHSKRGYAALQGFNKFLDQDKKFKNNILVFDNKSDIGNTQKLLAEAILIHEAKIVVGGISKTNATMLGKYADDLRVPTFLLSKTRDHNSNSTFIFHIFPNEIGLISAIMHSLHSTQAQKVAILSPSLTSKGLFVETFRKQAQLNNLEIVQDVSFAHNDFNELDTAVRTILRINDPERQDELDELLEEKEIEAHKNKVAFRPENIKLPAIVDFDALLVPDNFKSVRHIAKLLKFYGAKNVRLIGDQQWRSRALISPFDTYLKESMFVDYIGSYTKLPSDLAAHLPNVDPYFVSPDQAINIDYQLIGWLAGKVTHSASQFVRISKRELAKKIVAMPNLKKSFMTADTFFDRNGLIYWPAFLFKIEDEQIQLQEQYSPTQNKSLLMRALEKNLPGFTKK